LHIDFHRCETAFALRVATFSQKLNEYHNYSKQKLNVSFMMNIRTSHESSEIKT